MPASPMRRSAAAPPTGGARCSTCCRSFLAAEAVSEFGITPKVALLSHSNFGASDSETARKMHRALALLREQAPELEVDGEMNADSALVEAIRDRAVPDSRL